MKDSEGNILIPVRIHMEDKNVIHLWVTAKALQSLEDGIRNRLEDVDHWVSITPSIEIVAPSVTLVEVKE